MFPDVLNCICCLHLLFKQLGSKSLANATKTGGNSGYAGDYFNCQTDKHSVVLCVFTAAGQCGTVHNVCVQGN